MPFLIGMPKAKEFMMTGRWVPAEEALSLGLCNEVVAPEVAFVAPFSAAVSELVTHHLLYRSFSSPDPSRSREE